MSAIKSQDVLFTLKSIRTLDGFNEYQSNFEVVFMLKDIQHKENIRYVAFYFTSFETMNQYLKNLAKHLVLFSIDNLMKAEYPAIIDVEEHIDSPDSFKAFKIWCNYVWPFKACPAHFLRDYPE